MGASLDGQKLFDGYGLKVEQGGINLRSVERSVPGLDGVVSVSLGLAGREIKQAGTLRAASRSGLEVKRQAILGFMDGDSHTLIADGQSYADVRMDFFEVGPVLSGGGGVVCDYEIIYTQLKV